MQKWLILVSVVLLAPNFYNKHLVPLNMWGTDSSSFDANLSKKLLSVDDLAKYIDSTAASNGVTEQSSGYADIVSNTVFKRFASGYSRYAIDENWIAVLSGTVFWSDLSAIVIPADIMRYPMAACSQQGIVLMDFFRKKNIPARVIGFDHHFTVEAKLNNEWMFFDANLNPHFPGNHRPSFASIQQNNMLESMYSSVIPAKDIGSVFAHPTIGGVNARPGNNARVFHVVTKFLSHWLWIAPLIAGLLFQRQKKQWKSKKFSTSLTTE
jgi:hypothetical protein